MEHKKVEAPMIPATTSSNAAGISIHFVRTVSPLQLQLIGLSRHWYPHPYFLQEIINIIAFLKIMKHSI